MRAASIILALSAFASAASAAALERRQYPACVGVCINQASTSVGCSTSDAPCLCRSEAFVNQVAVCFASSCSTEDANAGVALGQELCKAVGLPISIPAIAASALSSGVSSGSGAPTASSGAPASPSSGASSAPSSVASPAASGNNTTAAPAAGTSAPASGTSVPASGAPAPTGGAVTLNGNVALAGLALLGAAMTLVA